MWHSKYYKRIKCYKQATYSIWRIDNFRDEFADETQGVTPVDKAQEVTSFNCCRIHFPIVNC